MEYFSRYNKVEEKKKPKDEDKNDILSGIFESKYNIDIGENPDL